MVNSSDYSNCRDTALEFLFFSYFKITPDEAVDFCQALNSAIEVAYSDATNQGAFNVQMQKLKEEFEKEKKSLYNCIISAKDRAKTDIYSLIKGEKNSLICDQVKFNEWHDKLCDTIVGLLTTKKEQGTKENGDITKRFTYGNAQKFINMTLKYLYVMAGSLARSNRIDDEVQWCNSVLDKARFFHIPIDDLILRAIGKNTRRMKKRSDTVKYMLEKRIIPKKHGYFEKSHLSCDYYVDGSQRWSNMNQEDYSCFKEEELFEEAKEKGKSRTVLEWENKAWIEQSILSRKKH